MCIVQVSRKGTKKQPSWVLGAFDPIDPICIDNGEEAWKRGASLDDLHLLQPRFSLQHQPPICDSIYQDSR